MRGNALVIYLRLLVAAAGTVWAGAAAEEEPRFRVQTIGDEGSAVTSLHIADLNRDGKPDILARSSGGSIWLENPGWTRRILSESAGSMQSDSDSQLGWINCVRYRAAIESGGLVVYEQPTLPLEPQEATRPRPLPVADAPWRREVVDRKEVAAFAWGDFDADGSEELAAATGAGLAIHKKTPSAGWRRTLIGGERAESIVVADLNADGVPEIITGPELRIHWNESNLPWRRHVIVEGFRTQSAVAADFTGDGRIDIITGDIEHERNIFLYSGPDWKRTLLRSGIRLIQSVAVDVDSDGDLDFIGAQYRPGLIFWLERPSDPLLNPWPYHVIDDASAGGVNGVHGLLLGDVDEDGKPDLVANSGWPEGAFPNSLAWFRIPAGPQEATRWERYIFANRDAPGLSHYLGLGDVNRDGRADLASAAKIPPEGNWFAWWEQPADPRNPWKKHLIAERQKGATNINIADLNGDEKPDFIATRGHGQGVIWYEAPDWTPHEIYPSLIGPHSLAIGDIDGDGDTDAVTCAKDSRVAAWLENDGNGRFTIHHIHEDQAAYEVRLIDMDGDGDQDLLVAGQESKNVVWFENGLRLAERNYSSRR